MRGVVLVGLVGLGVLLLGCQAAPPAAPPAGGAQPKLVVGYIALNATQLPAWVAKEEGLFDNNGLDVELRYLPTSASPTAALLAGEIQLAIVAEQPIQASLSGADLVYVAAPTSTIFFALYTRPEIADAASLRGKTIGITGAGAATETAARMALRSLRLDPAADVTLTSLGSAQNILAALQSGAIAAGVLSSPTSLQARALGLRELVDVAKLNDPFPSAWAAASRRYVADHPDAVRRFVRSIAEAIAFEIKQPEAAQRVLASYTKLDDPALARAAYEEVVPYLKKNPAPDPQAVRTALTELRGALPQAASADPTAFIDARFTDELEASGFIRSLYP